MQYNNKVGYNVYKIYTYIYIYIYYKKLVILFFIIIFHIT